MAAASRGHAATQRARHPAGSRPNNRQRWHLVRCDKKSRGEGGGREEAAGSLFSTKSRISHEWVKLPKFRNQPQNRLEDRNIFVIHDKYKIIAFS